MTTLGPAADETPLGNDERVLLAYLYEYGVNTLESVYFGIATNLGAHATLPIPRAFLEVARRLLDAGLIEEFTPSFLGYGLTDAGWNALMRPPLAPPRRQRRIFRPIRSREGRR